MKKTSWNTHVKCCYESLAESKRPFQSKDQIHPKAEKSTNFCTRLHNGFMEFSVQMSCFLNVSGGWSCIIFSFGGACGNIFLVLLHQEHKGNKMEWPFENCLKFSAVFNHFSRLGFWYNCLWNSCYVLMEMERFKRFYYIITLFLLVCWQGNLTKIFS